MPTRIDPVYGSVETRLQPTGINAVKLAVTANASGVASFSVGLAGLFSRLTIKPASGDNQPSDSFDLTITDEHGAEIYKSTTLSHDAATIAYPSATNPQLVYGPCTFAFANMGAGKKCEVICYFQP